MTEHVEVQKTAVLDPASSLVDGVVRLESAFVHVGDLRLRPWNMTLSSYTALKVMANRPGLSLVQLSRRCFVRPQTMSRIVAKLQSRGLVERLPNPDSERALRLRLTDEGEELLSEMDLVVNRVHTTIAAVLDPDEVALVDGLVRKLALAVEADIKDEGQ